MQADSPFYRGALSPVNAKHGMVDPSHTLMNPADDKEHKDMNFTSYDWKRDRDRSCRELQRTRRETFNIHGNLVLRLPERRDYFKGEEIDPVQKYQMTKTANKTFFGLTPEKKIDLNQFGKTNYLTAPKVSVGVTKHKNYLLRKNDSWQNELRGESEERRAGE